MRLTLIALLLAGVAGCYWETGDNPGRPVEEPKLEAENGGDEEWASEFEATRKAADQERALIAKADNKPERSPELQVLDRLVGSWNVKAIIKPAGGPEIKREFVSRRRWTLGGTFLQFEDTLNLSDPEAKEFQLLWTYDPVAKNYPAVIMDGPSRAELTGTWDAKTTTMHLKGTSSVGVTSKGYHRFIGKDQAEASAVFKDAKGKVVLEISWPQTRRDEIAKSGD